MGFQLSPGVITNEIDLTTIVPAVATTDGAIAGVFRWGPVGQRILVDNADVLVSRFGKPTNFNAETWFVASNFLDYGKRLYVSRAANTTSSNGSIGALNSVGVINGLASANVDLVAQVIKNEADFAAQDGTFDSEVITIARFPGATGNSLRVSFCASANAFENSLNLVPNANIATTSAISVNTGATTATVSIGFTGSGDIAAANTLAHSIQGDIFAGNLIKVGNTTIGQQYLKIASVGSVTANSTIAKFTITFSDRYRLATAYSSNTVSQHWEFFDVVETAPGASDYSTNFGNGTVDEIHAVVVDEDGVFTGSPGTILETWKGLSRATDAKSVDGAVNYYREVINQGSQYIWIPNDNTFGDAPIATLTAISSNDLANVNLEGGTDGYDEVDAPPSIIATAYDLFASAEDVDISLVLCGKARSTDGIAGELIPNYIIDNITEARKDCVAFVSPPKNTVVNNPGDEALDVVAFRLGSNNTGGLRSTSYAVMDSGYKYQYDKYNDVYRWIPLNGDIAGLCVRTDDTKDPWWSPAGFNRGQIKNIVRLAFNPRKAHRDILYKNGVNPVVAFPGEGSILYGDKTLLTKPSAFDRINVRRLFITLEKAIATAAKYTLFEFNDDFTRAQFRNMINPYLRDIQGRRGITDFLVVCDETNNTPEVIDSNRFIGDIYIKPARSINFIQLNFVAVRTGVEFSEVVGKFG